MIGNLRRPISWEPRTLTKQISMPHPHTHTPTNTTTPHTHRKNTSIVVMGLMETEERKREISRQRRRGGFSVLTWKRRVTWHAWQRKRVLDDRSDILKGSLPKSSPEHPRDKENPSIWGWTKRTRRRIEVKQLGEVWSSCTRDNVEAGESYFVLNLAADR